MFWSLGLGSGEKGATAGTHVHHMVVRAVVQAIMHQVSCAVGQEGVSLHLSESDATAEFPTLDRLSGQGVHNPSGAHLQDSFVRFHIFWLHLRICKEAEF